MSEPPGQLRTEVPASEDGGEPTVAISSAREVEQGARSVLLLAAGLFRLDVVPYDDSVQTIVRSLVPDARAEFRFAAVGGGATASGVGVVPPSTGRFGGEVVLVSEDGEERAVARVLAGSVCHLDRGLTSFTAQATLL